MSQSDSSPDKSVRRAEDAIDLFLEYRDKYGHNEEEAKAMAINEFAEAEHFAPSARRDTPKLDRDWWRAQGIEACMDRMELMAEQAATRSSIGTHYANPQQLPERGEAVNLASNWLDAQKPNGSFHITNKGVRTLAEAVMLMDAWIKEVSARSATEAPALSEIDARIEWLKDWGEATRGERSAFIDGFRAARATRPEIESIPEGCTPTDAKVLREANGKFAEENHQLRRALRFYANGMHYHGLLHWEGPSGDDNWLCPPSDSDIPHFAEERREFVAKLDEAMVEDGSIAAATLRGKYLQFEGPEDEPKVVRGEPEWEIEQLAIRAEGGPT